ncbi:MAG: shikimate dehydrogenase [Clostridia bacterium]|nr:shikimate dehydrogenase [Clostridia bacterium]
MKNSAFDKKDKGRYLMKVQKLRLGLIGKDVSASKSDVIHAFILKEFGVECEYEKFSVGAAGAAAFDTAMRTLLGDFDGFNVTIPYKRDVMEYLDEVQGDAFAFGAVNTVVSATRVGYNTDGAGFLLMLKNAGIAVDGKRVLVLGGGGSGRSSAAALKNAGADVFLYQRSREKLLETCRELGVTPAESGDEKNGIYGGGFDILVNCTGVGMHDSVGVSPVEKKAFENAEAAVDLIYTPEKTVFLKLAEESGTKILNGKAMLFYQAYYADCLYLGVAPSDKQAEVFYAKFLKENEGKRR